MKHRDLPAYDGAGEFTAEVECLENTPGFFPVHSGRLPEGMSQLSPRRVVIFGTDWGKQERAKTCRLEWKAGHTCRCQRFRREEKPYATEGNLFDVLTEAGLDPEKVFLTSRLRNSWGLRLGAALNSPGEHPFALDCRLDAALENRRHAERWK